MSSRYKHGMIMAGAFSIRCRDFSRRIFTISSSCPSMRRFCCQVSPISSASCVFAACLVKTTKRQGCLPCGEGAQRPASKICSINSRDTWRAAYFRTLRLPRIKEARLSVRLGNVTARCSDCIVTCIVHLFLLLLVGNFLSEHIRCGVAQKHFDAALSTVIRVATNDGDRNTVDFSHHQFRCRCQLIHHRNHAGMKFVAIGVVLPPIVRKRLYACCADGHIDLPTTPWTPPGV